jgi:hypothetical protein
MKILITAFLVLFFANSFAQKNVQTLQPTRLSIFKNGTYFIKKSARVDVLNNAFTIPVPSNALMGSYWLATSKDATIKSIIIKQDTFKLVKNATTLADYLKACINKKVLLRKENGNNGLLEGILLNYNEKSNIVKIKTNDNKIIIASAIDYKELTIEGDDKYNAFSDSIAPLSTIHLNQNISSTIASSLSLEKGIQWYPSYLLTLTNDKEATLSMKATVVNGDESFNNTDVDIIIGNPEMFYGKTLDPICTRYLTGELMNYRDNNVQSFSQQAITNVSVNSSYTRERSSTGYVFSDNETKNGNKLEDLYIYKLGKLDLEKNASIIVPIINSNLSFEDVYTADLGLGSATMIKDGVLDVFHNYRISNNSAAPLTTGSVLVLSKDEMPIAQAQLKYTPVYGKQDISISKAIDISVKNEEVEIKRERTTQKNIDNEYRYKINYRGTIKIENFQNKKIKLYLTKDVSGEVNIASNNGKHNKMLRSNDAEENPTSLIEWELEINPDQKIEVTYSFNSYSWL